MNNNTIWTSELFFERLDYFLAARNWTMSQLCTNADLSVDSLYKIRTIHGFPRFQSICIICDTLGVSLSDFFKMEITDADRAIILTSFNTMSTDSLAVLALLVKHLK